MDTIRFAVEVIWLHYWATVGKSKCEVKYRSKRHWQLSSFETETITKRMSFWWQCFGKCASAIEKTCHYTTSLKVASVILVLLDIIVICTFVYYTEDYLTCRCAYGETSWTDCDSPDSSWRPSPSPHPLVSAQTPGHLSSAKVHLSPCMEHRQACLYMQ